MNKIGKIIIVMSILVSLFFVVFANTQAGLAAESSRIAEEKTYDAIQYKKVAERAAKQAKEAEANARLAMEEAELAMERLLECQGNN